MLIYIIGGIILNLIFLGKIKLKKNLGKILSLCLLKRGCKMIPHSLTGLRVFSGTQHNTLLLVYTDSDATE